MKVYCTLCGEPASFVVYRRGVMRHGVRANHDLCQRCWERALKAANAAAERQNKQLELCGCVEPMRIGDSR